MAGDRLAKYRRVLPCLRMEHDVLLRGRRIGVTVEGLTEHCDVTLRLIDGLGRIHAEFQQMLGPETAEISLGTAQNVPSGSYEIVATPPLSQFHSLAGIERRIPITIAAAEDSAFLYGETHTRTTELLAGLSESLGPLAALVRLSQGRPRQRDDATLAQAVSVDRSGLAFAAAFVAEAQAAGETRTTVATALAVLETQGCLAGQIAAVLRGGSDTTLDAELRRAGLYGIGINAPEIPAALVALSLARPRLAGLAEAVLDRIVLGHALRSNAGVIAAPRAVPTSSRANSLSALSRLLWGVGNFGTPDAASVSLALANYQPPALMQAIALDPALRTTVEPDGDGALVTHSVGEVAITTHATGWQVCIGPDIVLAGKCEIAQSVPGAAVAVAALPPQLGLHSCEELRLEESRLLTRAGAHLLAVVAEEPFAVIPHPAGAGSALSGGGTRWACLVVGAEKFENLDDFARACTARFDGVLVMPDGTALTAPQARSPAPDWLDSPDVRLNEEDETIEVRFHERGLILDFG